MIIRKAELNDLIEIESVHKQCFPNNFSTLLVGKFHLLANFYKEYLTANPGLFLIAEDDEKNIVGFCMGYLCSQNSFKKDFLRHNFCQFVLKYFLLLITFKKKAWAKLFAPFHKKIHSNYMVSPKNINPQNTGDLLSICVVEDQKGTGLANELIDKYIVCLISKNMCFCKLSVEDNNCRAIHFYEKHGFMKFKKALKKETIYLKEIAYDIKQ